MTASAGTALKICIIAHNAYGAVSGASSGARQVGGVQNQTALMARWLTSRGHKVSVITWDEGQPDGVQYGGVTIYKMCTPKAGVPGMRFHASNQTEIPALRSWRANSSTVGLSALVWDRKTS